MFKDYDIISYKDHVRRLCVHAGQLDRLARKAESGCMTNTDRRMLAFSLSMVSGYKSHLLRVVARMGIEDGLSFMEDNEYIGFSVKNGRLYLEEDRERVLETCRKWVYGFPGEADYYQYAAGMYAICLAYADTVDLTTLYPASIFRPKDAADTAA